MWSVVLQYLPEYKLTVQARLTMMCLIHKYRDFQKGGVIRLRLTDLAKLLCVNAGLASKMLTELVEAEIIEYAVDEPEGRSAGRPVKAFKLTSKAMESLHAIRQTIDSAPFFDALLGLGVCNPSECSVSLTKGKRLLLAVLLAHADEFGVVQGVTKSRLESLTGLKRPSVTNYLKELKKEGFLDDMIPGFNSGGVMGRQSSIYFIPLSLITEPKDMEQYYFSFLEQHTKLQLLVDASHLVALGISTQEAEAYAKWSAKLYEMTDRLDVNKMAAFYANAMISDWLQNHCSQLAKIHEGLSSNTGGSVVHEILGLFKCSEPHLDRIFSGSIPRYQLLTQFIHSPYAPLDFLSEASSESGGVSSESFWRVVFSLACLINALEIYKLIGHYLGSDRKVFISLKITRTGGRGVILHSFNSLKPVPEKRLMMNYECISVLAKDYRLPSCGNYFGVPPQWLMAIH